MNKKIIAIAAIVVVFTFGFLYLNQSYLVAGGNGDCSKECTQQTAGKTGCDKSNCDKSNCDKQGCTEMSGNIKAGGEFSEYSFVTDKVTCNQTKADLEKVLLSAAGVKEVSFGPTCNVSHMTSVKVMYSAGETSEEKLASYLKDNKIDCSSSSGCNKDGMKSGSEKNGCDSKSECPGMKEKKSSDSKQL